ncbi:MAG TPA: 3-oxoacyl-ACP synthase, partial [Thermoanaerobaculia bacterium]|nr:3-oxoacyl-ACP synthase [Thermoanaerobaculia bacterium]
MFHAAIAGTGRAVPAKLLTNADLEKLVDTSDEWITTRTGVRERHMAVDGEALSDFCVAAGMQALESAGVAAKDLDA